MFSLYNIIRTYVSGGDFMDPISNVSNNLYPLIIGKLLGDGCITKQINRKPRFQFIHTASDKDWCFYCFEQLMKGLPLSEPFYRKVKDNRVKNGYTECFQVQSRTDSLITWLESIWYQNRKKIIPFYFLEHYINEQTLAWWYQDDGHLSQKNNVPKKIILSTDNFTNYENHLLIDLLSRKFKLYFILDAQNRLILYDQLQIYYFLRLVEIYMHTSMDRKTLRKMDLTEINNKRTTVYLPVDIHLTRPTTQINEKLINLYSLIEIVQTRTNYIKYYKEFFFQIPFCQETRGYQIIINKEYLTPIYAIKYQTGLTISQIISICFK